MPASNQDYWQRKITRKGTRDIEVNKLVRLEGWKLLRFWEHDVRRRPEMVIKQMRRALKLS